MSMGIAGVVGALLTAAEPSVVLATRRDILSEPASALAELGERVRNSPRARALIAGVPPGLVYNKWHGAHWVLADLADLGYPSGAPELIEFRDRVLDHWLRPEYYSEYETRSKAGAYGKPPPSQSSTGAIGAAPSAGQRVEVGFLRLHHPLYWHYDLLGGLVAMAELDLLWRPALCGGPGFTGVDAPHRWGLAGRSKAVHHVRRAAERDRFG